MSDIEPNRNGRQSQANPEPGRTPSVQLAGQVLKTAALAVLIGCFSGVGGVVLALTLHSVQHLAYGYSLDAVIGPESFLQGVTDASRQRRVLVLVTCGIVAGFGWYVLARLGRPLTSVSAAVSARITRMPLIETVVHGLLQMVTVALGSPLGREVAPREWGALFAQRVTKLAKVSPSEAQVLTACGAGAGLAAVYDVPIAGTIFVMEVLLRRLRLRTLLVAAVSCTIASWIARMKLGADLQYSTPAYVVDTNLVLWAAIIGAPFGAAGYAFAQWTSKCALKAAAGASRIWKSILSFAVVGLLATAFPQLLGNGKGPAELAFVGNLPTSLAAIIIVAKVFCVTLVLRAGAKGGLLTPGFSLGALAAVAINGLLQPWLPMASSGSLAILGAAAFLSSSMAMPITAVFLTIEFMDAPVAFILPITVEFAAMVVESSHRSRRLPKQSPAPRLSSALSQSVLRRHRDVLLSNRRQGYELVSHRSAARQQSFARNLHPSERHRSNDNG